ncbi:MAG: hypothetical protein K2L12_07690, partial [Clostridia bacterium]|nr:hypothetical protein [Clostridia bacterium]
TAMRRQRQMCIRACLNSDKKAPPPEKKTPARKDNAGATLKASRFVIASYLFGAPFADIDITQIPFCSEVHEIIAKYINTKKLLEERIQPAELFEFFEENSPEYEELTHILDYSDGQALSGDHCEKYFSDCVIKLKLELIDRQIKSLTARIDAASVIEERKALALKLNDLIKQKEKLKSGEK